MSRRIRWRSSPTPSHASDAGVRRADRLCWHLLAKFAARAATRQFLNTPNLTRGLLVVAILIDADLIRADLTGTNLGALYISPKAQLDAACGKPDDLSKGLALPKVAARRRRRRR